MTFMGRIGSGDLDASTITSGVIIPYKQQDKGVTLGVGTFYFTMGTPDAVINAQATMTSFHAAWSSAVAATITLELSNFPAVIGGNILNQGGADITDFDSAAGNWIQENPSTAIVSVSGVGNSSTAATVTAGGLNAGGCTYHLGNIGTQRARLKVITTVGGVMRVNVHGKGAA